MGTEGADRVYMFFIHTYMHVSHDVSYITHAHIHMHIFI